MAIAPSFTDEEQEMLCHVVASRVSNLRLAISKRASTQLLMENQLQKWLQIYHKLRANINNA